MVLKKSQYLRMNHSNPKLSIITVVYNDCGGLNITLNSIKRQSFQDYEWIIIDGGSIDGSVELIKENKTLIKRWVSEPDEGIYDAMNKGIRFATGDWVTFMNAGDSYTDASSLQTIFSIPLSTAQFIYSDIFLLTESGKPVRYLSAERLTKLSITKGMIACHQAMFVKRSLCPMYSDHLKYQGDLNWTMDILSIVKKETIVYVPKALIYFKSGGFSDQTILYQLKEHLHLITYRYNWGVLLFRIPRLIRRYGGKWLRRLLGIETFRFWVK